MKKIDYSCLVGSQVLMEFVDPFNEKSSGFLKEIRFNNTHHQENYINSFGGLNLSCRIYQNPNYWISSWCLLNFRLPDGIRAKVLLDDGRGYLCDVINGNFMHEGSRISFAKIDSVQVTGIAEGYTE